MEQSERGSRRTLVEQTAIESPGIEARAGGASDDIGAVASSLLAVLLPQMLSLPIPALFRPSPKSSSLLSSLIPPDVSTLMNSTTLIPRALGQEPTQQSTHDGQDRELRIYGPFLLNFKALSCSIHPFLPLYLTLAFYHLRDPMTILKPWGKKRSLFACLVDCGTDFSLARQDSKPDFPLAETTIVELTCAPHRTWAMLSIVSDNTVFNSGIYNLYDFLFPHTQTPNPPTTVANSRLHPESPDKLQLSPSVVDCIARSGG
ncbi:hypothetical protein C8J56DRAFT_1170846 [Mycena floridula]|nr:hypothetical protein C8J56DRAFT_1170846 [Mycena floridula]